MQNEPSGCAWILLTLLLIDRVSFVQRKPEGVWCSPGPLKKDGALFYNPVVSKRASVGLLPGETAWQLSACRHRSLCYCCVTLNSLRERGSLMKHERWLTRVFCVFIVPVRSPPTSGTGKDATEPYKHPQGHAATCTVGPSITLNTRLFITSLLCCSFRTFSNVSQIISA